MVAHAWNLSTLKAEAEGLGLQTYSRLHSECDTQDTVSNKGEKGDTRGVDPGASLTRLTSIIYRLPVGHIRLVQTHPILASSEGRSSGSGKPGAPDCDQGPRDPRHRQPGTPGGSTSSSTPFFMGTMSDWWQSCQEVTSQKVCVSGERQREESQQFCTVSWGVWYLQVKPHRPGWGQEDPER